MVISKEYEPEIIRHFLIELLEVTNHFENENHFKIYSNNTDNSISFLLPNWLPEKIYGAHFSRLTVNDWCREGFDGKSVTSPFVKNYEKIYRQNKVSKRGYGYYPRKEYLVDQNRFGSINCATIGKILLDVYKYDYRSIQFSIKESEKYEEIFINVIGDYDEGFGFISKYLKKNGSLVNREIIGYWEA